MRPNVHPLFPCALTLGLSVGGCGPGRLTEERIREQIEGRPLHFYFETGPAQPSIACASTPELDDADNRRFAIEAGWIERRCEDNHIHTRLTAEGRRRAIARWIVPYTMPANDDQSNSWDVKVALYEPAGQIEVQQGGYPAEKIVLLHGRWIPNEDGERLRATHWPPLVDPVRRETFVCAGTLGCTWYERSRMPKD